MNMINCSMSMSGRNYAQRAYDDFAEKYRGNHVTINFGEINFDPSMIGEHESFIINGMQFDMDIIHVERVDLVDRTLWVLLGENHRSIMINVERGVATLKLNWVY